MNKILGAIKWLLKRPVKLIKNSFEIFKIDLFRIMTSWVTIIILLGVMVLPAVYAWINICASWDPYGNTGMLKVVVTNEDTGASFANQQFNIGSEILTTLKSNDKLGWIFCDNKDEGLKMVEQGDAYAAIVIPKNFSLSLTTIVNSNPQKPTIDYYVNQKSNAIAPKIVGTATNTLKTQISTNIIKTAVQKLLEKGNVVGSDLKEKYPDLQDSKQSLDELEKNVNKLPEKLDKLSANIEDGIVKIDAASDDFVFVKKTIDDVVDLNNSMSDVLGKANSNIEQYSPELRSDLASAQKLFYDISDNAKQLSNEVSTNKPVLMKDINQLKKNLSTLKKDVNAISARLSELTDEGISQVMEVNDSLSNDIDVMLDILQNIEKNTNNLQELETLCLNLEQQCDTIETDLGKLQVSIHDFFDDNDKVLANLESACNQLSQLIIAAQGNSKNLATLVALLENNITAINKTLKDTNINMFKDIISTNESILKQLEGLPSTIDDDALAQLSNSVTDLKAQIQAVRKTLASTQQTIQTQLDDAKRMFNQISDICEHLSEALSDLRIDTNKFVESFSNTLEDVQELLDWSNDELAKIQKAGNSKIDPRTKDIVNMIDVLRTRLTDLNQAINDNNGVVTVLNDIQDTAFRANSSIGTILNRMNDKALQNVQDNLSSGSLLLGDINDVLGNSKGAIDDLSDFSDDVVATGQTTLDRLEDVKKKVPKLQSAVTKINSKVHELDNKVSYEDLSKLLSSNVDQESAYFSSPVDLTTHDVFVSENYGKGLAPFYSVLALWVGGMFLTALLKTKVGKTDGPYTPREEYFGKYMLFGSMAVAQGIVTALGDLFILKIPVDSPVLFVILAGFCSLIFSMILYSLVATLSNVGKAVGVIFMLLQITASGGTFPIQVTPIFFRAIYSYMPFTYAINGFREAIYGVNFNHLTKDIVVLIIFGFIFTTYGRVFKKPLNKLFEPFSQNLKKSGVIH